ncbi:MAG TPA: LacI family DNA-binding transcriptional regulator [Anaerolineae bacterium]|nr:LacI family DNA-binding transcriptional regulator [Anaerolineae bacterium]
MRRTTLADVAALAGVSRGTASRALAGDARISPPTTSAVQAAAEELGYVPNVAARSLRVRKSRVLGLLVPDLGDPVHAQVAAGFQTEAAGTGYSVIIIAAGSDIQAERRAMTVFIERATDGICLASCMLDPAEATPLAGPVPVAFLQPDHACRTGPPELLPRGTVVADDAAGIAQAVRHLLATGHRDIAYLGLDGRASDRLRRATVRRVLRADVDRSPRVVGLAGDAWTTPQAVGAALGPRPPDAVVCYDDKLALSLLDGLRMRGLTVPDDVAVTGFDDVPFARLSNPRLTTVATPVVEMGLMAARALVEAVESGDLPSAQVMPVELVIRESSGAPPSEASGSAVAGRSREAMTAGDPHSPGQRDDQATREHDEAGRHPHASLARTRARRVDDDADRGDRDDHPGEPRPALGQSRSDEPGR